MKRKIVQHGSSSLTITLPIRWASKFGLKKGDELNVEESGPMLLVSTEQQVASPRKELTIKGSDIFTKNNLSHLYHLGYDEIEIYFDDKKTLEQIKQRLPTLLGFEIIEQTEKRVLIKSIATTLDTEFDTLLRKSFQITNEMARSLLEALQKKNYSSLPEIRDMESLNNKFTDICTRILNKKGYKNPKRTMQVYEIVKNIERIADEFKYICDLKGIEKADKRIVESLQEAVDYYLAFYSMFYKFDSTLKKKIYLDRKKITEKFKEQLKKSKGINSILLHHVIKIVEKTYDGAGGYFALVL